MNTEEIKDKLKRLIDTGDESYFEMARQLAVNYNLEEFVDLHITLKEFGIGLKKIQQEAIDFNTGRAPVDFTDRLRIEHNAAILPKKPYKISRV